MNKNEITIKGKNYFVEFFKDNRSYVGESDITNNIIKVDKTMFRPIYLSLFKVFKSVNSCIGFSFTNVSQKHFFCGMSSYSDQYTCWNFAVKVSCKRTASNMRSD